MLLPSCALSSSASATARASKPLASSSSSAKRSRGSNAVSHASTKCPSSSGRRTCVGFSSSSSSSACSTSSVVAHGYNLLSCRGVKPIPMRRRLLRWRGDGEEEHRGSFRTRATSESEESEGVTTAEKKTKGKPEQPPSFYRTRIFTFVGILVG